MGGCATGNQRARPGEKASSSDDEEQTQGLSNFTRRLSALSCETSSYSPSVLEIFVLMQCQGTVLNISRTSRCIDTVEITLYKKNAMLFITS